MKTRGKGCLLISIVLLIFIVVCMFSFIFFSVPTRAEEIFGTPDPNLDPMKLYIQSTILMLREDQLKSTSNLPPDELLFNVQPGDNLNEILNKLSDAKLVQHPQAFRAYLIYTGIDTRIQPRDYHFSTSMSEIEIANILGNPIPKQTTISILPGWRMEEIADTFSQLGLQVSRDDFLAVVTSEQKEGYLFPGIYVVDRDITPDELVDVLYQAFLSQITPELEGQLSDQGFSIDQAITLASIIQRESLLPEEMPLIASVFINRLNQNINLAADPTVQYALGFIQDQGTWWKNPLSLEDLDFNSPYNTYINPGLPPGPICNPSLGAIEAVASPADTSYLYFRAVCDNSGKHIFAETFEEHLNNACTE